MNKVLLILSCLLFLFIQKGKSQNVENWEEKKEEILMHLDRQEYVSGEKIWFKSYCLDNSEGSYSRLSKLVYIHLVNEDGHSLVRKKVLLSEGVGNGCLQIPKNLPSGVYKIIAYTHWMKNFAHQEFFDQNIFIYNRNNPLDSKNQYDKRSPLFQISLEGNELISGLTTRIFYKVAAPDSLFTILIKNNRGVTSDSLITSKKSGTLLLTPAQNFTYKIALQLNDTTITQELPPVKEDGFQANLLKSTNDSLYFNLQCSDGFTKTHQELFFTPPKALPEQLEIPSFQTPFTKIFPHQLNTGIHHLQFTSKQGKVLWERKVFIDNSHSFHIDGLKSKYKPGEQVSFNIHNTQKQPENDTKLSVSIKKIDGKYAKCPLEISTNSLIDKLNAIQNNQTSSSEINHELLFLHFAKDTNKPLRFYPENKGVLLQGQVSFGNDENTKQVSLSIPDSIAYIKISELEEKGQFHFHLHPTNPDKEVILKAGYTETPVRFKIEDKFIDHFSLKNKAFTLNNLQENDFYKKLAINNRIQEVYDLSFETEAKPISLPDWRKHSFYGEPDQQLIFNNYQALDSIQEYLHELTWSVTTRKNNEVQIKLLSENAANKHRGHAAIFIDGVLYNQAKELLSIEPEKCKKLEILNSPLLLNNKLYYGAVCLYTHEGNLTGLNIPPNAIRLELSLYDEEKYFILPETKQKNMPDFRNTLFWTSNMVLPDKERKKITFPAGHDQTWYEMVVFGIDNVGNIYHTCRRFEVRSISKQ